MKKVLKWVGILFVVLVVLAVAFGGEDENSTTFDSVPSTPSDTNVIVEEQAQQEENLATEEPEGTASQRNAIRQAENYLRTQAFSREGLIKQLEFEGYSNEDATYGVDNISVDYNEQASKKAKQYLDIMPYSRSGLIEQLEFEGFTREQAEFGADSADL